MNTHTKKIFQLLPQKLKKPETANIDIQNESCTQLPTQYYVSNKAPDYNKFTHEIATSASDDVLILPFDDELLPILPSNDSTLFELMQNEGHYDNPRECVKESDSVPNNLNNIECDKQHVTNLNEDTLLIEDTDQNEENKVENMKDINTNRSYEADPDYNPNEDSIENEDSVENEDIIENENSEENETPNKKRQRKRKSDSMMWNYNKNKFKRMKGVDYKGRGKSENGKAVFNKTRPARKMLVPCNCKHSIKEKTLKCKEFSEETRQQIYTNFWEKLNWEERKQYIKALVDVLPSVRRKSEDLSRRGSTFVLRLKKHGVSYRVCKKMFLNTLAIGEWSLHNWAKVVITQATINEESNKRISPQILEAKKILRSFYERLPKMESHYCRARSSKLYLEPIWQSKADLYLEYQKYSQQENPQVKTLSIKTFYAIFDEMNLSLYQSKKDQCDLCANFKANNLSEEEYLQHQKRKEEAREEKVKDKKEAKHVFCIPLL
nr:uncharacterized protein LOC111416287 isoform X2 [Onthophagus taurus]